MSNETVVVDDHPAIRMAVRLGLRDAGLSIAAETGSGVGVLEWVQRLMPSWLILEVHSPGLNGFSVIKQIVDSMLPVNIIVLSSTRSKQDVIRCQRLGAQGFVRKQDEISELLNGILTVKNNKTYFPDLKAGWLFEGEMKLKS